MPAVPTDVAERIIDSLVEKPMPAADWASAWTIKGGSPEQVNLHTMSNIDGESLKWMLEHIDNTPIQRISSYTGSPKVAAHTDSRRSHGVNYLFTTGSDKPVLTQFYKPRGAAVLEQQTMGLWYVDESELEVIEEVEMPINCWWYINTRVIHGTNTVLTGDRIMYAIGYADQLSDRVSEQLAQYQAQAQYGS
jgi:hypothetical protein